MKVIAIIIGFLLLVAVFSLLFSLPVLWLWNWLMPTLFGLPEITWMQALGLLTLSGILFKSSNATTTTTSK